MSGVQSWMREAVDVMRVGKQGQPVQKLIKMCGACGSTIAETAAVLNVTVEYLSEAIEGKSTLHIKHLDKLVGYWFGLWWWHCYRLQRPESMRREAIIESFRNIFAEGIFESLPKRMREDWKAAHYDTQPDTVSTFERKAAERLRTRLNYAKGVPEK